MRYVEYLCNGFYHVTWIIFKPCFNLVIINDSRLAATFCGHFVFQIKMSTKKYSQLWHYLKQHISFFCCLYCVLSSFPEIKVHQIMKIYLNFLHFHFIFKIKIFKIHNPNMNHIGMSLFILSMCCKF